LDRVLEGLSREDATRQVDGGSSFAWTLAHLSNQLDTWVNVRLQHLPQNPVFDVPGWSFGGTGATGGGSAGGSGDCQAGCCEDGCKSGRFLDREAEHLTLLGSDELDAATLGGRAPRVVRAHDGGSVKFVT